MDRFKRMMAALAVCLGFALPVSASPIAFFDGTLSASLKLYDIYIGTSDVTTFVRHEYVLGQDFMAGVPGTGDPDSMVDYSATSGDWLSTQYGYSQPLTDACTPETTPWGWSPLISVAARGNCTFQSKWSNMQAKDAKGGILVDTFSGLPSVMGGTDQSVSIPFFLVSKNVWSEMSQGSNRMDETGTTIIRQGQFMPILSMDVTWTRNQTVPEPQSLWLIAIGLAGLAGIRRYQQ